MGLPSFHMVEGAAAAVAPYSHYVEVDGWVFVTGQIAMTPGDDDAPIAPDIVSQTRRTLDNLILVLADANLGLEHVVAARVFLTDFERDYERMNAVYASYFAEDKRPMRTCIGVTALARGSGIEIDFVARRP